MTQLEQSAFDALMALNPQGRANVMRAFGNTRSDEAGSAAWCLADLVHYGVTTNDPDQLWDMAHSAEIVRDWADELFTAADQELGSMADAAANRADYRYDTEATA